MANISTLPYISSPLTTPCIKIPLENIDIPDILDISLIPDISPIPSRYSSET